MVELTRHLRSIALAGAAAPRGLALAGDRLALTDQDRLRIYDTHTGMLVRKSEFPARHVRLSPDARFLAAVSPDGLEISLHLTDSESAPLWRQRSTESGFRSTPMAFHGDWLLYSVENGVLGGVCLSDTTQSIACNALGGKRKFWIEHIIPLMPDLLGIIGYDGPGEKSDLLTLPFAALLRQPELGLMGLVLPKEDYESADTFTIAPYDGTHFLCYQDQGQAELDEEDDEFNGFELRDRSGNRVAPLQPGYWPGVTTGAPLMATDRALALLAGEAVHIVPRGGGMGQQLQATWDKKAFPSTPLVAFEPHTGRMALYHDGQVHIHQLRQQDTES